MKVVRLKVTAQAHKIRSEEYMYASKPYVLTRCGQKLKKFEFKRRYTIRKGGLCRKCFQLT